MNYLDPFFTMTGIALGLSLFILMISHMNDSLSYSRNDESSKTLKISWNMKWVVLPVAILSFGFSLWNSYSHQLLDGIAGLDNEYNHTIPNKMEFLKALNVNVIVNTNNKNLIIDVANADQSVRSTDEWKDLLNTINAYNANLTTWEYKVVHPWLCFSEDLIYPHTLPNVKHISFNELTNKKGK